MNKYYVYALIDPRDNEVFYIGKGSRSRIKTHVSDSLSGKNIKNKQKHDKIMDIINNGYKVIELKLLENLNEDYAYFLERAFITGYRYCNINITNVLDGGNDCGHSQYWLGKKLTKEHIKNATDNRNKNKKNHKSIKGIPFTDEHCKNISIGKTGKVTKLKGKKKSEEHRKHLSESMKGRVPWNKGKTGLQVAWNKGKKSVTNRKTNNEEMEK